MPYAAGLGRARRWAPVGVLLRQFLSEDLTELALPVGIHRQTVYDGGIAIDRDAFDVELRLTVGNDY